MAMSLSGCVHTSVTQFGSGAPMKPSYVVYKGWEHNFILGLLGPSVFGSASVNISNVCPTGNGLVMHRQNVADQLLAAVTFFIYTPSTVKIFCNRVAPPAYQGT